MQWVIPGIISDTNILRKFAFFKQNSLPPQMLARGQSFFQIPENISSIIILTQDKTETAHIWSYLLTWGVCPLKCHSSDLTKAKGNRQADSVLALQSHSLKITLIYRVRCLRPVHSYSLFSPRRSFEQGSQASAQGQYVFRSQARLQAKVLQVQPRRLTRTA